MQRRPRSIAKPSLPTEKLPIPRTGAIVCSLLSLPSDKIKEVAVVRQAKKPRDLAACRLFVDLGHPLHQMLDHKTVRVAHVQCEIGVLERIHIQMHRVAATVALEYPRHRRRRGAGKKAIDEKASGASLLQAGAGAQRAQILVRRA